MRPEILVVFGRILFTLNAAWLSFRMWLQIAQINMEHIGTCLVCGLREATRHVIKLRCIVIKLENKVVRDLVTKFKFFFLLNQKSLVRVSPTRLSFRRPKPKTYRTFVRWLAVICKLAFSFVLCELFTISHCWIELSNA